MRTKLLTIGLILCLHGCSQTAETGGQEIVMLDSPAGPGSMTPHLQSSDDGTLVMSWLEPADDDMALRYSTLADNDWASPVTVAEGENWFVNWADFPSVAKIRDGLWAAHWLQKSAPGTYAYDVRISVSPDGLSWSDSLVPHRDGTATEHGFASLHQYDDGFMAVWLDGRNMAQDPDGRMTLRWAAFDERGQTSNEGLIDAATCDCCQTDLAPVSDGIVAVYRDRSEAEIRDISAVRITAARPGPVIAVADDNWRITGCPVNGPAVASNNDQLVVAWFTGAGGVPAVKAAFSSDAGRSFSEPVVLSDVQPLGRVDVVWLTADTVLVNWIEARGDLAEIRLQKVTRDQVSGPPLTVATTTKSRRSGLPQLARSGDDLVFAWTEVTDETRVRTAMIPISEL